MLTAMQTAGFTPASLFGVPLSPIPPGMRWNSVREMMHELMADLHRSWVQDYLMRPDPELRSSVLSSHTQLARSFAFTVRLKYSTSILFVPAFCKEDLTAGVLIEVSTRTPTEAANRYTHQRFVHCVVNNRTGTLTALHLEEDVGTVELTFSSLNSPSCSWRSCLSFKATPFFAAFRAGVIDFAALDKCLLGSGIGYSARHEAPCSCLEMCCIECHGRYALTVPLSECSSPFETVEFGDFYSKAVSTLYENSVPIEAVPRFAPMSSHSGLQNGMMDIMVSWAIFDGLCRRPSVVPFPLFESSSRDVTEASSVENLEGTDLTIALSEIDNVLFKNSDSSTHSGNAAVSFYGDGLSLTMSGSYGDNTRNETASDCPESQVDCSKVPNLRSVRIAPAPWALVEAPVSPVVESVEDARLRKEERRKIQNREAAFRSSQKRSERRKRSRLISKVSRALKDFDSSPGAPCRALP